MVIYLMILIWIVVNFVTYHERRAGVDAPLTQSFLAYLLLTLVYVPIVLRRRQKLQVRVAASANPWTVAIHYLTVLSCLADSLVLVPSSGLLWCTGELSWWVVQTRTIQSQVNEVLLGLSCWCWSTSNVPVVKAYQYSYITSVTLLDCWTVVWVVMLTWYALGTRYSLWQFVGAGTCVAGLALVLLSDAKSQDEQGKLLQASYSSTRKSTTFWELGNHSASRTVHTISLKRNGSRTIKNTDTSGA